LGFCISDVMTGECFAVLLTMSSANPMRQFCGSKFYWTLGYSTSLRDLDRVCSVSGSKMPKNPKYFRNSPGMYGDFSK